MRNVALICARGGSKRIYRKNVQLCNGLKLIEHPIRVAKECHFIDQVFVSTDDDEISEVAKHHGCEVIRRPYQLTLDSASSAAVSYHGYREIWKQYGNELEFIVNLWATSPCIQSKYLISAYKKIKGFNSANVISAVYKVTKSSSLNNYKAMNSQGVVFDLFQPTPQGVNVYTTNNLVDVHYACGAFSIQRIGEIEVRMFNESPEIGEDMDNIRANDIYARDWTKIIFKRLEDLSNVSLGEVIDEYSGIDINYPEDLKMAEAILKYRNL